MNSTKSIFLSLAALTVMLTTTLAANAQKKDQAVKQQVFY
jgi:hypothetical protein